MSLIWRKQKSRIKELDKEMEQPGIWENHKKVQALNQEKSRIEKTLGDWEELSEQLEEQALLLDICREEGG